MNAPFSRREQDGSQSTAEMLPPLSERRDVRKAVILAAGRGRRMGKLTADRPKDALEVGGHALIDWQIEALRVAGVKEIAVVTGHAADALGGRDVTYIHNPDWATGTQVDTLLMASDWIGDEPVIVSYSDIIYHPCAALALLERPGDIVVAYDADHRWLWKRRFGNWLKDSETFRLGPGQVLTEIGGKPTDIEELDGQFMGLMLLTPTGLDQMAQHVRATSAAAQAKLDFTALLAALLADGARIHTAANALPWIEIDSAKDLRIARSMTRKDEIKGTGPQLIFPLDLPTDFAADESDDPAALVEAVGDIDGAPRPQESQPWDEERLRPFLAIREHVVENAFAIQNWGRSGSTFVQSLFDDHPQVLSTPNFYSRHYFIAWATTIGRLSDADKIDAFLRIFRQWWDTGLVDATAGLHRLGPEQNEIAGVDRYRLEGYLRAAVASDRPITRRRLFEAGHLAYAFARRQQLSPQGLQILYPVHGEPRAVAAALLEDFPDLRFLHTIREPVSNFLSSCRYIRSNLLDERVFPALGATSILFGRSGVRYGRTQSMFGDRPYFDWLATRAQFQLVRLEDLNMHPTKTVGELASWIGISACPQLSESSFDGLSWWNRVDSREAVSRIGKEHLVNSEGASPHLRRFVNALSSKSALISRAYCLDSRGRVARYNRNLLIALLFPWRIQCGSRTSTLQRLVAARRASFLLPQRAQGWLQERVVRERFRTGLLEHSSASTLLRSRLKQPVGSGTIHAAIIIFGQPPNWRIRAMSQAQSDGAKSQDQLAAFFLDEAVARPSVRELALLASVLLLGAIAARCMISFMLRSIIANAMIRHNGEPP